MTRITELPVLVGLGALGAAFIQGAQLQAPLSADGAGTLVVWGTTISAARRACWLRGCRRTS
jgi:hypothetical protein